MSQPPKSNGTVLVPLATGDLGVKLPDPPRILVANDAERTRKAIMKHGAVTHDAKMVYERDGIAAILSTDKAGANKFIAELADDDVIEDGHKVYIRQPPINQELSRRIEEQRDAYQVERLRDTERCMNAARDAPQIANHRLKLEALARKQMPKVKSQVMKNADACISGAPLQKNAEVHHIERVADNPNLALDPKNMRPVNPQIHDQIHAAKAHTPQALNELAKQEGWPLPSQQKSE